MCSCERVLPLAVQGIASDSDALRAALNALELEGVEVPQPLFLMREIQPLRYSVYTCRALCGHSSDPGAHRSAVEILDGMSETRTCKGLAMGPWELCRNIEACIFKARSSRFPGPPGSVPDSWAHLSAHQTWLRDAAPRTVADLGRLLQSEAPMPAPSKT